MLDACPMCTAYYIHPDFVRRYRVCARHVAQLEDSGATARTRQALGRLERWYPSGLSPHVLYPAMFPPDELDPIALAKKRLRTNAEQKALEANHDPGDEDDPNRDRLAVPAHHTWGPTW